MAIFTIMSVMFALMIVITFVVIVFSIRYECWPGLVGAALITMISAASLSETTDPYVQYRYLLDHKPTCNEFNIHCVNRNIEWLEDSLRLSAEIDVLKDAEEADYILAKSKLDSLRNLTTKEK